MDKIGGLTGKVLADKCLNKAAQAAFVCNIAKKVLKQFFDKDFLKEVEIIAFKDGNLYLSTPNSSCAQELKFKENQFLKETNNQFGGEVVLKVRFKNPNPKWLSS